MVETLTLTVGGAVSRALLKLWLRDAEIAQSVGLSLSDLAERGARSFLERRGMVRSFERISEEVASKLAPFIEAEFAGLPTNEVEAAAISVQRTIDATRLDDEALFATDLDPLKLEARFRSGRPDAVSEDFLPEAGASLYGFILREAATYIAELASTLPAFQSRATREMLSRESTLISLVEEVLERLPEDTGTGPGDPDRFEAQYRREVARKLDRLELFGVNTSERNRRFKLSVAYLGLTARTRKVRADDCVEEGDASKPLTTEAVLSRGSRHLLRGEAGSGKTTLLQWLAVSVARRDLGEELQSWRDAIPFFLRLREFVGQELPQPSQFVAKLNSSLAEKMPARWAVEQLESGRALVLVDGVDELREAEREAAAEWLGDLVAAYPEARYVVTSRPPAVSGDWLKDAGFAPAFLEEMDLESTEAFIEHWHRAAADDAEDEEEIEELPVLASRIRAAVRSNRQIRTMATSPLLCAMLCALNRDWEGQLPKDRIALYRIALEMLLTRRDSRRDVGVEDLQISQQQKEALLQSIAHWLLINGFSDAGVDDIANLLRKKVEAMPGVDESAENVLKLLLLRSGLLREPAEGRIDFIHKTFQEYLAAKQIVEDRSVGLLVERAHEDQWQEVVILAAGLGTESGSEELIWALLARAVDAPDHRHRLQLLAVASLETAPLLPKNLQEEIHAVLEELIPPRSMSEAKAIASAGEVAVPMLAAATRGPVVTAAPTVRALASIGGTAALTALERFAGDKRLTVARELMKAWDAFPIEEYAQRVLADSPLEEGAFATSNPERLAATPFLRNLTDLTYMGLHQASPGEVDWGVLERVGPLRRLELDWDSDLVHLALPPEKARDLEILELVGTTSLESISFDGMEKLRRLRLLENLSLIEFRGLASLLRLQSIQISQASALSRGLEFPLSLQRAVFRRVASLHLELLSSCSELFDLELYDIRSLADLSPLSSLGSLTDLRLIRCRNLQDLSPLAELGGLKGLTLRRLDRGHIDDLRLPAGIKDLRLIDLPLASFETVAALHSLQILRISGCSRLNCLPHLGELTRLKALSLAGCSHLRLLDFLADHPALQSIDLEGCREVPSLEPLYGLAELRFVNIRGCSSQLDPTPLLERGVKVTTGSAVDLGRIRAAEAAVAADLPPGGRTG